MGWKVKLKTVQQLHNQLGLEDKGRVQQFLGQTTAKHLRKYVSFDTGTQEKSTNAINGGKQVEINVPYAQFQAGGKVMVGVKSRRPWAMRGERKVVINKNLKYHNGAIRGARPFERMKADKKDSILEEVAEYARGLAK